MSGFLAECGRKAFHMLSLVYLAAYHWLGYPRVVAWALAWTAVVTAFEAARLRLPGLNAALMAPFSGMARPEESRQFSGIFHTTAGFLLLALGFGDDPRIVTASILYVAFGDAAAALAGKSLGRHKILGGRKSLEGSLACLLVCALVGAAMGFPAAVWGAGALAATAIELLPTTRYFNDNLWMPVGTAACLAALL